MRRIAPSIALWLTRALARQPGISHARASRLIPLLGWLATAISLALAGYVVLRSCEYNPGIPLRYGIYFLLEVAVPGCALLYLLGLRPLSPSMLIGLGLPTGFALEIFSFLALSAIDAREAMPLLPVVWIALAAWRWHRHHDLRLPSIAPHHVAIAAVLAGLFFATVLTAAGQMFSESPLVDGLPQRPIFHDWVYLLSRAAVIKNYWPLEDPSLAGTALQYHYFLLVHVASASSTTNLDVTWVMLRLVVVPLGLILVVQAYALGKLVARSRTAGVLAAFFTLIPGELSSSTDYGHLVFLGLFVRWLYVSPTFFFGVVFFGALLLAVCRARWRKPQLLWLVGVAAAATAAKGSVLPVLLVALAITVVWTLLRERRLSRTLMVMGVVLGIAFAAVYGLTMAQWGSGEVQIQPYRICSITEFWHHNQIPWTRMLKRSLHAPDLGTWLGWSATAAGVVVGTAGFRLLAIPYLFSRNRGHRWQIARWLFAAWLSSKLLGLALHFDADSELYFLLLARVPISVLAGAFVVDAFEQWSAWRRESRSNPVCPLQRVAVWSACGIGASVIAASFALQMGNTISCQARGLADWWRYNPDEKIRANLMPLYEAMAWVRNNTERNAVLLTNAFTDRNLSHGRGISVDDTTAGVYYYYSALTERRLWVEGPTYLLDQTEARLRLRRSSQVFYQQKPPPMDLLGTDPAYVVLDHGVGDGATFAFSGAIRVFANGRFEIFRLLSPSGYALN